MGLRPDGHWWDQKAPTGGVSQGAGFPGHQSVATDTYLFIF